MTLRFRRPAPVAVRATLLLFALQTLAEPAAAATLVWLNAAGGSIAAAANWNPAQVPATADILRFDLANTYTATFPATADSVATHQLWGGDVTLDCTSPHNVRTGFHVASLAGQVATARLLSGTLRAGWAVSVGAGAGADGTLRVSGAGATLAQNTVGASPLGTVVNIGGSGTGTGGTGDLIVRNGGLVTPAYRINVGRDAGSLGTLSVRGEGTFNSTLRRSSVIADSSESDCQMGMNGGHGVIEVLDGALFRLGRDLRLSDAAGDSSDITIGGAGVIDSSRIRVKDDLWVCVNPSTVAGAAGGIGNITLDSLGVLVVDDSTVVGDPDGSSGQIIVQDDARIVTKHLILQQSSGASMALQGGLVQVKGGTLSTSTGRLLIPGDPEPRWPVVELLNGATASFTGTSSISPLTLGTTGTAELRVTGGSHLTANGGRPSFGEQKGTAGTLVVSDGGVASSDKSLILGTNGVGWLRVKSGGLATFNGLDLSSTSAAVGNVDVRDAGSVLTSTGLFNVGGTAVTAGNGAGGVDIGDGGLIALTSPLVAGTIWPSTYISPATGGRLELTGGLTVRGDLDMAGGEVAGGAILLRGDGRIVGEGNVASTILAGTDTTVSIVPSGNLQVGRDTPGGGVLMRGLLDVGSSSLTLVDPDSAIVGSVEMSSGGELFLPAGGGVVETGKHVTGDGTIHGPLVNHGSLVSVGAAGLRFAGTLYGTGQGAKGDLFEFLSGGGFEGAGLIDAMVQADSGSLIRATAPLDIGKAAVVNGVVLEGRIEDGGNQVNLRSGSPVNLEGELSMEGGGLTISGPGPFNIAAGGRVEGRGTFVPRVVVAGTIAPGFSAGKLSTIGNLTFTTGTYEAELGNHSAGECDTLSVAGAATLAGTLDLRRLPQFAAAAGDSFQILVCGTRAGTFTNVTLDGAPLAGELAVHYGANGAWVVALQTTVGVEERPGAASAAGTLSLASLGSPGAWPGVELSLPAAATVALHAYDPQGREVCELQDGPLAAGRHRFELGRRLQGTGLYFIRAVVVEEGHTTIRTTRVVRVR